MVTPLPFFNWNVKKTLSHIPDPLIQAQIRIICFLFVLNLVKLCFQLPANIVNGETTCLVVSLLALLITVAVLKLLLARPTILKPLIHFSLIACLFYIWSTAFMLHQHLSILVLQHLFLLVMCSFYGLGKRWGLLYGSMAVAPYLFNLFAHPGITPAGTHQNWLTTTAYTVNIVANFIAILGAHYYFHSAIFGTLDEKKRLNEELQESSRAKTDFLSTMSHELRTPLNSVIGMANLLLIEQPSKEQKENLDVLKFSAESLLLLINGILDFNKIGSDKVELETTPFNLARLLENASAGLRIKAIEKGLNFHLYIDPIIGDRAIEGDPTRLTQIIYNLVANALKFTEKGSIYISASVVERKKDFIKVHFSVKDTGIGISPDKQTLVFEPFKQASKNITRKFGGTGLGLSIVKHLLSLHNSSIYLESWPNEGSYFYFDISYPLAPAQTMVAPKPMLQDVRSLSQLRILLAEDNHFNILFMKKLLSKWGVDFDVAENGQQALDLMHDNHYDAVLMDMHMPVVNGFEAALRIREMEDKRKAHTYIIALTASVSDNIKSRITDSKMDDYLSKPFQPDELYLKLKQLLPVIVTAQNQLVFPSM